MGATFNLAEVILAARQRWRSRCEAMERGIPGAHEADARVTKP
jgi:hypothetical protein